MSKMRVFELARELNIPGKELLVRMKDMGFDVDGNFNVMDDDLVAKVKARMLEPVTRVEKETPAAATPADAPRKRRIISARKSEEVHKIQESLGVSGPLPEDEQTRLEMETAEELPPPQPAAPAATGFEAQDQQEEEAAPHAAAPAPASERPAGKRPTNERPRPTERVEHKHVPEDPWAKARIISRPAPGAAPAAGEAKPKGPAKRPGAGFSPAEAPGGWRDVKRADRDGRVGRPRPQDRGRPGAGDDEWIHRKKKGRKNRRAAEDNKGSTVQRKKAIRIGSTITVSELAGATGIKSAEIIKKLLALGIMATVNQPMESSVAELVAAEFDLELEVTGTNLEDLVKEEVADPSELETRPPIVTVMGHVDHGKTSLLDRIRKSDVTLREAGGITQHIGAYYVKSNAGDIVFLDTPGHEAFTSLRARGADITDLVVLVVAADDGVMPQTIEAIDHAKAAKVPIIVAINKMDKPGADPTRVKTQLMEHGLLAEELGGDTAYCPVSAKSGEGIPQLLEMIHLQAEILELKATAQGMARGYVIESQIDRQRGPVATLIVQRGTVRVGDHFVAGTTFGRVRALFNDRGKAIKEALPAMPVEILGCNEPPTAGDLFVVMEDEKATRQIANVRAQKKRETENTQKHRVHLEDFLQGISEEEAATLNLVVKADAQGSLEALKSSLLKLGNDRVKVDIVRAAVGGITETDVALAATTNAIMLGFCVRAEVKAQELAHAEGLDIKIYNVIYNLINDVHDALEGLLQPIIREQVISHLEVRKVFFVSKGNNIIGGYVTDGKMQRNATVRVYRDNVLIHSGAVASLRRFNDDVAEVQSGYECGVRLSNFNDLKEGDLVEAFINVEEAQKLDRQTP